MEGVDLVIYINLATRPDRKEEMEKELKRLEIPESKILRWEATRLPKNGSLGCTLSHIAVMEYILTLPETVQTVMVLEDDFDFADNVEKVRNSLKAFLEYPRDIWDFVLLSHHVWEKIDHDRLVSISLMSQRTSGYIVNRPAVPLLLANFKEGADKLQKTGEKRLYSIDIYWWKLMESRKCFYFNDPIGHTRKGYSNITGRNVEVAPSKVEISSPRTNGLRRSGLI